MNLDFLVLKVYLVRTVVLDFLDGLGTGVKWAGTGTLDGVDRQANKVSVVHLGYLGTLKTLTDPCL